MGERPNRRSANGQEPRVGTPGMSGARGENSFRLGRPLRNRPNPTETPDSGGGVPMDRLMRVLVVLAALAGLVVTSLPLETAPRLADAAALTLPDAAPGASWAADGRPFHPVPFMPIWAVLLLGALLVGSFGVLVPRTRPRGQTGGRAG